MKITAKAGVLADALALAEFALGGLTPEKAKRIVALSAVHIRAADGAMMLTSNILDYAVTVKAEAEIVEPGEIAISLKALSALVAGFPKDVTITIGATDKAVTITGDKGRFRLPTIPLDDMPAAPELDHDIGMIELEAADLLRTLTVASVASKETTRYYLAGVFLHTIGGDLIAVATDGHQLMRVATPASVFSTDRSCIVPLKAATVIQKILRKTKPEKVTLRRSKALLMMKTPDITFITKLIDAEFPAYERIIPEAAANVVTCDNGDLVATLKRLAAVATDDKTLIALQWQHGQGLGLFLARQPDDGHDVVAAETTGNGQVAARLSLLAELLEEINGDAISLSTDGTGAPIVIRLVGDERLLALLMPCAHNFAIHESSIGGPSNK
jgi:DNA polymerase III subunit beta